MKVLLSSWDALEVIEKVAKSYKMKPLYLEIKGIFWKIQGTKTRKFSPSSIKEWMKVLLLRFQVQPPSSKFERYYKIHKVDKVWKVRL